jgi:hypothetical protein
MTCIAVELNSFLFDGTTQDADGVVYSWESIDGWFDSPDFTITTDFRPIGASIIGAQVGGRTIALNGLIHDPNPTTALGDRAFQAMRTLKANCATMFASALLAVDEPLLPLQAIVGQSAPMRFKPQNALAAVEFQIPLLAPDPRRYSMTPTSVALTGSDVVTNNGDIVSPPVATFTGGSTVFIRNFSVPGDPFVQFNGTVSSPLVIDMANLTAVMGGLDVSGSLSGPAVGPPAWWSLISGPNAIGYGGGGSCQLDYRDAYS